MSSPPPQSSERRPQTPLSTASSSHKVDDHNSRFALRQSMPGNVSSLSRRNEKNTDGSPDSVGTTQNTYESTFGTMSPSATDRVFPVRSVVSVDPNPTPGLGPRGSTSTSRRTTGFTETGSDDGFPGFHAPPSVGTDRSYTSHKTSKSNISDAGIASALGTSPSQISNRAAMSRNSSRQAQEAFSNSVDGRYSRKESHAPGERMGGAQQMQSFNDVASKASTDTSDNLSRVDDHSMAGSVPNVADDGAGLVTARFKHVVTEGGHAVIIGRGGDTLQRCEDEPIHIPGAVQGFGLLIALAETDDGKLQVRIVSENSTEIIGHSPKQLFALDSFCDILSEEQADNLLDHVDFVKDEEMDPATNGPEVFTISIKPPQGRARKMWCAMHINETHSNLIICEFELEDDTKFPLVPMDEATPEPPEDTLSSDPTPEEYSESTLNISKPLRILRSARKRQGEAAAMEVFNIMSQVQEQLANAPTIEVFLKVLVGVVKELTGFHRVMVYQFDASWNGRVVTELVDPRATKDLYKGLNFPASDIPKQARDMYKINKVRLLYDRDQETARLVCRTLEDLEKPLDLTFAYLRAMSPIHIKYLANMAVRASMSISINAFGELWGLIACHSYGSKGMRVSFPIRKMCRLVGDTASRNIERLSYASRLQARKLINTVPTQTNPSGYIIASSDDLLNLFDADCGLLSIRDETKILGRIEQTQEALAMLEYLRLRKLTAVTTSTDIATDFPDLIYGPGFTIIAGVLLVPLSVTGSDFIVFFRQGQLREVKWAGNPYEKFVKEGTEGYLEPRKSFKTWSETVVGKCREWTEEQIETAAVLCLVYGKFIDVWRQKEAALQNSQLTKLLLANSAHEVRTPLNAIINYLEIALEGSIDQETRDNLSRSHSASKSLICVINDLLDLTKTEEGLNLIKDEIFDFPATIKDATDSFTGEAKRKDLVYQVDQNAAVPPLVVGDQRRVRQVISNVVANAIKFTSTGSVRVETWLSNQTEQHVDIDVVVQDTGCGMSSEKLDKLFRDLEQVQSEGDAQPDPFAMGSNSSADEGQPGRALGLGLAIVARIVRNMNGQLRLKSEEGQGSRFVVQFGFELPAREDYDVMLEQAKAAGIAPPNQPTTPPVQSGEVMLVNKSAQKPPAADASNGVISHRKSADSMRSHTSVKSVTSISSARSDVDRLIEAIQEPIRPGSVQEGKEVLRSNSVGHQTHRSPTDAKRPTNELTRSKSSGLLEKFAPVVRDGPGMYKVQDSKTSIKPIRLPEKESGGALQDTGNQDQARKTPSRVLFEVPKIEASLSEVPLSGEKLQVLVAEDDPINSKIIKKRLEKLGHVVHLTINGEECSSTYGDKPKFFDVVLMDMQMPIVDGLTSTKIIRSFEKLHSHSILSRRAAPNGRVPIFAVSASLVEKERQTYVDAGFDGWILKPVDFNRLKILLSGIVVEETRQSCVYQPGQWERGGWFGNRNQADVSRSYTTPSSTAPVSSHEAASSCPIHDGESATDVERARLEGLNNDAVHAASLPANPGSSGNPHKALEHEGTAPG